MTLDVFVAKPSTLPSSDVAVGTYECVIQNVL
jgi:hypothetical protein